MNDDTRFTPQALAEYLRRVHRTPDIAAVRITPLGGGRQGDKGYGYGIPLRVDYEVAGVPRRAVIESVRPGPFGHEHMADRAHQLLWAHDAFGRLPRHVRSLDVGAVRASGELVPLGNAEELFQLAEFVEGHEYADDLIALRGGADAGPRDRARCDALADYLADVHAVKSGHPRTRARRRTRRAGRTPPRCRAAPARRPDAPRRRRASAHGAAAGRRRRGPRAPGARGRPCARGRRGPAARTRPPRAAARRAPRSPREAGCRSRNPCRPGDRRQAA